MPSDRAFLAVAGLLFAMSMAVTIAWSLAMSGMGGMAMTGGWTMSMMWMRMSGTWLEAAVSFIAMWVVMMVAMMLPALVPMLLRYRQVVGLLSANRLGWLTTLTGLSYFAVWVVIGLAVFPLGVVLAEATMQEPLLSRAVPVLAGMAVLVAGTFQFIPWKTRHLDCCRALPCAGRRLPADAVSAMRYGLRHGGHCLLCCANLMAVLLVIGMMDWRAMAAITAAITLERLAPADARMTEAIGVVTIGAGLLLIAKHIN